MQIRDRTEQDLPVSSNTLLCLDNENLHNVGKLASESLFPSMSSSYSVFPSAFGTSSCEFYFSPSHSPCLSVPQGLFTC